MAKRKKLKFWNIQNVLTTLKSWVVGLTVSIPMVILAWGRMIAGEPGTLMILSIIGIVYFIISLFLWGWLANKWWKWN